MTYIYKYRGLTVAGDHDDILATAIETAHTYRHFEQLEKVNPKIDKTGLRWISYAVKTLSKLSTKELLKYIEEYPL